MSDLIDDPHPQGNMPEFTVSELSGQVKTTLESSFGRIRVRGEVGRVFRARSGHLYYDIKDDRNVLACTTWKGQLAALSVQPEEGLEVVVTGRLTAFGAQSKYNLNVDEVAVAGVGALMAMLEKRKAQLQSEGLFDLSRKKPLPYLPEIIGVVTSPSGAVIRDILHRLRDRFPRKVLIWPVAVQGQACAAEVARAIRGFNALTPGGALPRPDLLIVARGGGSIEDLWGFNEEIVARAAADSDIPLISAVGHETDTTLIDYVSDQRAPTPTAAAELAVPVRMELLAWVEQQEARLTHALTSGVIRRRDRLRDLSRALPRPASLTQQQRQRLDHLDDRLPKALQSSVTLRRAKLSEAAGSLRPATLTRAIAAERRHLQGLATRLAPAMQRSLDTLSTRTQHQASQVQNLALRLDAAWATQTERRQQTLAALDRQRQALGYEATLQRGYAVVHGAGGVVTTRAQAEAATALAIEFRDGRLKLGSAGRKPGGKATPPDQGSLF
jgi:exodeoxyribonuclease VII large subunit